MSARDFSIGNGGINYWCIN